MLSGSICFAIFVICQNSDFHAGEDFHSQNKDLFLINSQENLGWKRIPEV